ncbi:hypothetical protein [Micromonospora sp. NBC_01638]|uniref:DUF7660 family protein n=1 Tax=Micromonospora sp. NBC_01638 TaxID=2975982 RepID=UPI00386BBBBA|nr:hypothetical protein OG811_18635 [Micromonospora sp. NBC_01638]
MAQEIGMDDVERFFVDPSGELVGLGETVRSHDELIEFVVALRSDLVERREKWENRNVGDYLGSIARAFRDMVGDEYDDPDRWADTAGWLWVGRNYE